MGSNWILAAPPVIVVLAPLAAQKEPPVVHFAATANHRDASALRDAEAALLLVRELVPVRDGQFGKGDPDSADCADLAIRLRCLDLVVNRLAEERGAGVFAGQVEVKRIDGLDAIGVDRDLYPIGEVVAKLATEIVE